MLFGTVVYNIWTKRVGDLDYESINFCSKVRYTIVTAAAHLRKGAGAAAGRTLKIEYGCERYVEMLRIINEAWKGNVDAYLAGVIRGVARFISVYEGEYSRERLVQQLARTHPKTITQLAQKDTGSSANRHMRQILRIYNGASREMSLPLKN